MALCVVVLVELGMVSRCVVQGILAVECTGCAPGVHPVGVCSLLNWQVTVQLSGVNGQSEPRGCTVALSRHDLLRLLQSLRSADGLEPVREVAEQLLQELIEAESTTKIHAEWGEHTATRTTWRNGHHEKGHGPRASADSSTPRIGDYCTCSLRRVT